MVPEVLAAQEALADLPHKVPMAKSLRVDPMAEVPADVLPAAVPVDLADSVLRPSH